MPPCRVRLTHVTAQLPQETFPLLNADATRRNDAAHHCEDIRKTGVLVFRQRGGKSIKKLFQPQKKGQFGAESVHGGGQSRNGDTPLEDIVRSETVRNFDVRNRSRTRL